MIIVAAAALALGWAYSASAQAEEAAGGASRAQSVRIRLTNSDAGVTVTDAGRSCDKTTAVFFSTGKVHLVVKPGRNQVHANLANVGGTGTPITDEYEGVGAHRFTDVMATTGTVTVCHEFKLVNTTHDCARSSLPVTLKLVFNRTTLDRMSSTATAGPGSSCR